jgi:hypothetical protein
MRKNKAFWYIICAASDTFYSKPHCDIFFSDVDKMVGFAFSHFLKEKKADLLVPKDSKVILPLERCLLF